MHSRTDNNSNKAVLTVLTNSGGASEVLNSSSHFTLFCIRIYVRSI